MLFNIYNLYNNRIDREVLLYSLPLCYIKNIELIINKYFN